MDWSAIITSTIETGGLAAILIVLVTLTEKKGAAMYDNAKALANAYKELADEYKVREAQTQTLTQAQLSDKEQALLDSNKMNSSLRHSLDDAHTQCAVANLLRCNKTKCTDREPPLGATADNVVESSRQTTRRIYKGGKDE